MISQADIVFSTFGYWPDFADAKIMLFAYEPPETVHLKLSYIDAKLQKAAIVGLRFIGVRELALTNLLSENVVDRLTISEEALMRVELEGCYGLTGNFACTAAEVTELKPNNSF